MQTKYRFTDLVDIDEFSSMLNSFYEATGILHGLVDDENNVISAIGWQDACAKFHRVHPDSNERCLRSNRYLADNIGPAGYVGCACLNGLMDYAAAIVVEGRQLATLYFGQILHEAPDMEFFRRQAREFNFDEKAYLEAIRRVPVIPKARIEPIMAFYSKLAQMLARSGLERLRQRQLSEMLRELATHRETAREDERRRIAREIHDELGQCLTGLKLQISALGMEFGSEMPAIGERVGHMATLVGNTQKVARGVIGALRPPALDSGIGDALAWLATEFSRSSGIPCQVVLPPVRLDLDEDRATVLFRIAQESLTNVARHAKATRVVLTLSRQDDECSLEVRDNGRGFKPATSPRGHLGIVGMRERALTVDGWVAVDSLPGSGTVVRASISAYLQSVEP